MEASVFGPLKWAHCPQIAAKVGILAESRVAQTQKFTIHGINALNKIYIFLKNTYRSRSLHFRPLNSWFQEFQFLYDLPRDPDPRSNSETSVYFPPTGGGIPPRGTEILTSCMCNFSYNYVIFCVFVSSICNFPQNFSIEFTLEISTFQGEILYQKC